MTITYPRTDIMTAVPFEDQPKFQLLSRQEYSRTAFGTTIGKDLGSAIWMASYTTSVLPNDVALSFEAKLNSLDGVVRAFEAGDLRRPYPKAYPAGGFSDSGVIASVNANNRAMAISGLPASFVLSAGDYLSFDYGSSRALHQVVEDVTANGSGTTAEFEVRPFIRPGFSVGGAVKCSLPRGLFTLMPGSVSTRLSGPVTSVVSFQAVQYI